MEHLYVEEAESDHCGIIGTKDVFWQTHVAAHVTAHVYIIP